MTDNIFKQMREQMEPGQEVLDRLQAAIGAEQAAPPSTSVPAPAAPAPAATAPAATPPAAPAPAASAPATPAPPAAAVPPPPQAVTEPGKHRRRNPVVQYLLAAAAIVVLFVAAGFLLQNWLPWGDGKPGLPGGPGTTQVVDSGSVRSASDYQELYNIISESREGMYAGRGGGGGGEVLAMPMAQGDSGSGQATEAAAAPTAPSSAPDSAAGNTATASDVAVSGDGGKSAGTDYSETNVQVSGIDEGDIVKTDGRYIYVLNYSDQYELVIYAASGEDTVELSRLPLTSPPINDGTAAGDSSDGGQGQADSYYGSWNNVTINELYISGSMLLAIGTENYMLQPEGSNYSEYTNQSFVLCFDVSDPSAPKMLTEFSQSGYFESSRLNGNVLYLLSNYYPSNNITPDNPGGYVPLIGQDGASATVAPGDVCIMPGATVYPGYTVVSSIDVDSLQRIDQQSILGQANIVYMSADNLYIGSSLYNDEIVNSYQDSVYTIEEHVSGGSTQLMRIGLDGGKLSATAQCTIGGQLLNQFSLDEYQGNLRLAITKDQSSYQILRDDSHGVESYKYDDPVPSTNAVYVLGPEMTVLGSIEGLAEDERIYSARFDGAVGYMVTFRQIDPLFAIDLSDPYNPKVTSELKIPGFSTYLHPFGPGKLLGLGYETVDGRTIGIKLSMFDVNNPFDVRELHVTQVAGVSGYSEALSNHKAVLVDVEKNIIGIPLNDYQNGQSGQSYLVYQFTEGEGFALKGRLELSTAENSYYYYYYYGGTIRGLYVDGYLYVYSGGYLDVFELQSLAAVKSLQVSDYSGYGYGPMPEPAPMPTPRPMKVE